MAALHASGMRTGCMQCFGMGINAVSRKCFDAGRRPDCDSASDEPSLGCLRRSR